jgi:putative GTP pyrophosphokinase
MRSAVDRDTAKVIYDEEHEVFEDATQTLRMVLEKLLDQLSDAYGVREGTWVEGEAKGFKSFYEKAERNGCTDKASCLEKIRDFARARVVVQTVDDVYRLVDLLDAQEVLVPHWETEEDYIENPRERGYRSFHIHVGVEVPVEGKKRTIDCELQIRSAIQHAWSNFSHEDFYKGGEIPEVYVDQIGEMSNLLAAVDKMAAKLIARLADESTDQAEAHAVAAPQKKPGRIRRASRILLGKEDAA